MRRSVISAVLLLLAASAFAGETKRYFVGTRAPIGAERILGGFQRDAESQPVARNVVSYKYVNAFAADLTDDEVHALKSSALVDYIEPVVEMRAFATPIRNYVGQTVPAGIDAVKARDAWIGGRGLGSNVVVIDTGVDMNHPDLKGIYQGGLNTYNTAKEPLDDAGHGTHVAGTIAAADDNSGVVGVAPAVSLWAIKVLNASGSGTNDKLVTALEWVITKKKELGGNWVVNLSLGHEGISPTERTAVNKTIEAGILIVAASGNDSEEGFVQPVSYPAAYPNVISVGAVNASLQIAAFSNQGPEMELVAPGVGVLSTVATGFGAKSFVNINGTLYGANPVLFAKQGTVSGELVDCGKGNVNEIPASVAGKIALIQRSNSDDANRIGFAIKGRNAKEAGAIGVVIYDADRPSSPGTTGWTFHPPDGSEPWADTYDFPVALALTLEDGLQIKGQIGRGAADVVNDKDDYDIYNGTSMATPHVAGAAALIWALAPNATPQEVTAALTTTASDLGATGHDPKFGFGMLNVFAAAKQLAPNAFGSPAQPTNNKPTTGRPIGRRR